jgi:aspartyl-tRNA(Asn)/glutamyl-tRNA(Gln) amidotransferase subunit B
MRFARRAVEFETKRQIEILENGGVVEQETRGFDAETGTTYPLREKEDAHDYRYFPEPDLPPVVLTDAHFDAIKAAMPPLPDVLEQDFKTRYGLPEYDAELLTQERETAFYFLELAESAQLSGSLELPESLEPRYKSISKLLINKLLPWSAEARKTLAETGVSPAQWNGFLALIESGQLGASAAYQRLFPALLERPAADPAGLAAELNLIQSADADFLAQIVEAVLARFPDKVQEYQKGKKGLMGFFMGEVMKQSAGKAEPRTTTILLQQKLGN